MLVPVPRQRTLIATFITAVAVLFLLLLTAGAKANTVESLAADGALPFLLDSAKGGSSPAVKEALATLAEDCAEQSWADGSGFADPLLIADPEGKDLCDMDSKELDKRGNCPQGYTLQVDLTLVYYKDYDEDGNEHDTRKAEPTCSKCDDDGCKEKFKGYGKCVPDYEVTIGETSKEVEISFTPKCKCGMLV